MKVWLEVWLKHSPPIDYFLIMGVDISVWRARIGSFNLSTRRFSGKRAKPTTRATNGLEVAVVATIILLILAGDVDFNQLQQRNMDIRTTVGLKVETTEMSLVLPSQSAAGVLHAYFDNQLVFDVVQPDLLAVKLYSKGLFSETVRTSATTMMISYASNNTEQAFTPIRERITDRSVEVIGCYPTVEALRLQHEHPGQVCQQPIFSLIAHHSLSPPVATSCPLISPATTVPYHSPSHTTTITTELPRMSRLVPFSHTGAALGLVECIAVVLFSLLIMAGDIELNPGPRNSLKLDANEALFQLHEVGFPAHLWDMLATGLMLGGQIEQFEGRTSNSKLQQLITYWIANNEQASWQQLVDAMKGCGQLVRAKQLAENVRALPSTSTELSDVVIPETLSSPPLKKRKSQPVDPVTNYTRDLKYQYRQALPDEEKLLTTSSKYYIDLAVISSETVTRCEADEFTRKTLHGLTEEVLRKKTPIALQDILKPGQDSKPVRCVLIEGAPGVGKSTLAWELCHKWEELECVKGFDLVVLVQLRERSAQEAQKLSDLFPRSRNTNVEEILDSIGNGKGVLLVLDGFDELPREQRQKESVYIQLIKGRELPEATVIITSRPSVSADLINMCQHNIDRRLEILGFTEEHVVEYAESVFSESETQCTAFLQYINGNPIIKGMMYLPLNAVIVTMIFKDSYGTDCPFPKTMTQLFDALTRSLIRRHLVHNRMITDDYCMPQSLQCSENITKLGQLKVHEISVAVQVKKLAEMAYDGLLNETYIFSCDGDFDHLGLMKKTKSLNDISVGPNYSFCFLHLTLQEYLSAIHIFLLSSSIEVPPSLGRRGMVSRFLAGLCIHGDDCLYQILKTCLGDSFRHVQLVRCVYECDNIVQKIPIIKDFFDRQDFITVRGVTVFDYYLVGHCISHIGGRWSIAVSSQVEVDLLVQGLGSDGCKGELWELELGRSLQLEHAVPLLKLFQAVLHCLKLTSLSQLVATILRKYISPGSALRKLDIMYFLTTEPLNISRIMKADVLQLSDVLRQSSLNSLTIECFIPTVMVSATDVSLLRENSNLKNLVIPDDYLIPLAPALHDNTSLVLLGVEFGFGEERISKLLILAQIIQKNHSLQQLEIGYTYPQLSEEVIQAMVQVVEAAANSTSIKKISCSSIVFASEYVKHSCAKRSSSAGDFLSRSLTDLMQSSNPRDKVKSFIITFTD